MSKNLSLSWLIFHKENSDSEAKSNLFIKLTETESNDNR